jgi:hypothetical protein
MHAVTETGFELKVVLCLFVHSIDRRLVKSWLMLLAPRPSSLAFNAASNSTVSGTIRCPANLDNIY